MTYKENNKIAILKWRENNTEKYNEYMNNYIKTKYRAQKNSYRMKSYYLKREFEIFRRILLDL
jgi:hypothetical protein